MKEYKEYNNELFSRWAPVYDVFEILLSDVRKKIILEIHPIHKSILDVATGTGSLAIELSKSAEKVVGIDLSSEMLNIAEKKRRNKNLSFLQMDASKMKFDDGEFDIVTISLGLHDMPLEIRSLVLQEAKRVLKKDGKLFILEYDLPKINILGPASSHLINIFESKYYLDFIQSDFENYLNSFGFKIEKRTNYLFNYLRLITLSK
ncbi:MAG: class I SAM-dependent methyltransferase [Chitinophagales bacterium]